MDPIGELVLRAALAPVVVGAAGAVLLVLAAKRRCGGSERAGGGGAGAESVGVAGAVAITAACVATDVAVRGVPVVGAGGVLAAVRDVAHFGVYFAVWGVVQGAIEGWLRRRAVGARRAREAAEPGARRIWSIAFLRCVAALAGAWVLTRGRLAVAHTHAEDAMYIAGAAVVLAAHQWVMASGVAGAGGGMRALERASGRGGRGAARVEGAVRASCIADAHESAASHAFRTSAGHINASASATPASRSTSDASHTAGSDRAPGTTHASNDDHADETSRTSNGPPGGHTAENSESVRSARGNTFGGGGRVEIVRDGASLALLAAASGPVLLNAHASLSALVAGGIGLGIATVTGVGVALRRNVIGAESALVVAWVLSGLWMMQFFYSDLRGGSAVLLGVSPLLLHIWRLPIWEGWTRSAVAIAQLVAIAVMMMLAGLAGAV